MFEYAIRRIALGLLVIATVAVATFLMLRAVGDIAIMLAGQEALSTEIAAARQAYGLDQPIWRQFLDWVRKVAAGDLGRSYFVHLPVSSMIWERIPVTATLAVSALVASLAISIPLGIAAAIRPGSRLDHAIQAFATLGQAMPTFWLALLLILIVGVQLGWLPIAGNDSWQHFVLPTIVLAFHNCPAILRLMRGGMIEAIASDYVRTAHAKGLALRLVLFKHALRNAVLPVVSLAAVQLGNLLEGSIVIETIFALDGIGMLAWQSIQRLDFLVLQGIVLIVAGVYVLLTIGADILNARLDPRLRLGSVLK
jgi:peptide/nickel transport system permease protein